MDKKNGGSTDLFQQFSKVVHTDLQLLPGFSKSWMDNISTSLLQVLCFDVFSVWTGKHIKKTSEARMHDYVLKKEKENWVYAWLV